MNGGGGVVPGGAEVTRQLLDFNQKLDINLLDNVVQTMYTTTGPQQRTAQEVLTSLKVGGGFHIARPCNTLDSTLFG